MSDMQVFKGSVRQQFDREITEYVRALPADTPPFIAARRWLNEHQDDDSYHLFLDWIADHELALLAEQIKQRLPKRTTSKPKTFAAACEGFAAGDVSALSDFSLVYRIKGVEKPLGDMTGTDHEWAAHAFQTIGTNSLLLAAVHRRVARMLGDRTTKDMFSEATYRQLFGPKTDPVAELLE